MEISKKAKWMASASVVLTLSAMAGQVGTASAATVSATTFNRNFTTMSLLKSITAKGSGGIGAILPDTVSSTRYVEFDAPYLTEAMKDAGLTSSQISVVNAHGSDATEFADAQADITKGDKVLIMDPLDSGVGAKIESYAAAHGVKVIDYDRLTLGGNRTYYDSFNNNFVGTLLGQGLVSCIASEHVSKPVVLVMHGATTDNNATLFADGYDGVLQPYFASGKWTLVGKLQPNEVPAGTWTPSVALTEFQQEYTAHSTINAVLMPNDENGAPVITYLKSKGIKANSVPGHRPGRHLDRSRQRPHWLPVRHRLQAHLPRGSGCRRPRRLRTCRHDPAGRPGQRHHERLGGAQGRQVRAAAPRNGSPRRTWPRPLSPTSLCLRHSCAPRRTPRPPPATLPASCRSFVALH